MEETIHGDHDLASLYVNQILNVYWKLIDIPGMSITFLEVEYHKRFRRYPKWLRQEKDSSWYLSLEYPDNFKDIVEAIYESQGWTIIEIPPYHMKHVARRTLSEYMALCQRRNDEKYNALK